MKKIEKFLVVKNKVFEKKDNDEMKWSLKPKDIIFYNRLKIEYLNNISKSLCISGGNNFSNSR